MATMKRDDKIFAIFDVFRILKNIIVRLNLYEDLRKEFLEYTVCLGLNMFITSADWSKKAKFYARHRLYCKQIAQNQDEYMTIIHTPSYIHFLDVFKLPWFVFFLKYYYTEFKQYLKKRKSRIKNATR